jgi:hypothetical protein
MLNKILKSFSIDCAFVQVADNVSVNCEDWQKAEITRLLAGNLFANSLSSRSPTILSFAQL